MDVGLAVPHFGRHVQHFRPAADNVRLSDLKSKHQSCKTCIFSISSKCGGPVRSCTCKGKLVKDYNICDKHK